MISNEFISKCPIYFRLWLLNFLKVRYLFFYLVLTATFNVFFCFSILMSKNFAKYTEFQLPPKWQKKTLIICSVQLPQSNSTVEIHKKQIVLFKLYFDDKTKNRYELILCSFTTKSVSVSSPLYYLVCAVVHIQLFIIVILCFFLVFLFFSSRSYRKHTGC